MVNQKLYIINLSNFYNIISELKEHIGYEIVKFDNKEILFDKYESKSISTKNSIFVVDEKEYNFFIKNINEDQIIKFKPPVNIFTFIENLNIRFIQKKYQDQSNINVKDFFFRHKFKRTKKGQIKSKINRTRNRYDIVSKQFKETSKC